MSSIAEILINHSFRITGSDLLQSTVTDRLAKLGAKIFIGHREENVGDAEAVVYSSAVKPDNVELITTKKNNIPIIRRAEMLAELMRMKFGIAIAGTHGKTTTTSMIGSIAIKAGMDPTVIVGGISPVFGSNARIGESEFLIAEADEFDRSFLQLTPTIAVITTMELEHLDCYADMDDMSKAFLTFANRIPFFGTVILCGDEPEVMKLKNGIQRKILTYGINDKCDINAGNIEKSSNKISFDVLVHEQKRGRITLMVPGEHNVKNALAAIAIAEELDVPFNKITTGLESFSGVKRRFEILLKTSDYMVVDDYAHHFTEIKATLKAAKEGFNRRIIAVFQPHLFTRTRDFYQQFAQSFSDADIAFVAPVYPARENPIEGVSGKLIVDAAKNYGHKNVYYIENREQIVETVRNSIQPGDMIISMGAGDIWKDALALSKILAEG